MASDVSDKGVPEYNHALLPILSPQGREIHKKGFLALDIETGGPHPLSHQPCIRSSPDKGKDPVDNINTRQYIYIYICQGNASTS